jgi:hypothetical protein
MFPGLTNIKTNNPLTPNMKGMNKGDMTQQGPIATQNLGGNSLTQMMRSLQNYLTTQGANTYGQGMDITGAALPGFNVAGDTTGTALGTTGTALDTSRAASSTLDPAQDYWAKLLSGDQQTMMQAIAPTATQAGLNYANAATAANQNMPRGGYAGVLSAGLPQAQAREVNTALYALQPKAAAGLTDIGQVRNQIAGTQGQIGGVQNQIAANQAQIANWLASLGIDISKLGLTGTGMGLESLMTGRGQDVGEHGQAMSMASQLGSTALSGPSAGVGRNIAKSTYP